MTQHDVNLFSNVKDYLKISLDHEVKLLTESNINLTNMLYDLCGRLERHHSGHYISINEELSNWWKTNKIKKQDMELKSLEHFINFTDEEKELLGFTHKQEK